MKTKTTVNVFDINREKHLGTVPISSLKRRYDAWRAKGYAVCVDRDGDVCIDDGDGYDDGKYYEEQLKS